MTKTQAEQVAKEAAEEIAGTIADALAQVDVKLTGILTVEAKANATAVWSSIILSRLLPLVEEEAPAQADPNFYIPEPTL